MAELKTTFEDIHLSDEGTTLLREAMSELEKDEQDHLKTKDMSKKTWGSMLKKAFANNKEDYSRMVTTLTEEELNKEFDDYYGSPGGEPFTAWGEKYVYFPVVYDGLEWVGSAPRNPCDEKCSHFGGW